MIQVVRPRKRLCLRGLTHPVRSPWGSRVTGRVGRGVWARVSTRITGHLFPAPRKGGRGSGPATAGEPIRVGPAWGYGTVGSLLVRGVRTVSSCGRPGCDPGWYSGHGSNVQTPKLEFGGSPDGLPELDSPCLLVKGTDCAGVCLAVLAWLCPGLSRGCALTCCAYVRLGLLPVFQGEVPEVLGPLVGCM